MSPSVSSLVLSITYPVPPPPPPTLLLFRSPPRPVNHIFRSWPSPLLAPSIPGPVNRVSLSRPSLSSLPIPSWSIMSPSPAPSLLLNSPLSPVNYVCWSCPSPCRPCPLLPVTSAVAIFPCARATTVGFCSYPNQLGLAVSGLFRFP